MSTPAKPASTAKLAAIYAQVPDVECRGLCAGACGPIPVHPSELKQIRLAAGRRVRAHPGALIDNHLVLETNRHGQCTLLKKGRCSIYHDRPLICRLFGAATGLLCPYGCKPKRFLTRAQVKELIDALDA
jgi:uncharacterized protein